MRLQTDGDLEVRAGEVVTVRVTALNTHYLAIFSDLAHAEWTIVQPVHAVQTAQPGTQQVEETRSFVATGPGVEGFAVTLDFVRNQVGATNAGASYVIQVGGSGGQFTVTKQIRPLAPFPIGRPFVFEVIQ